MFCLVQGLRPVGFIAGFGLRTYRYEGFRVSNVLCMLLVMFASVAAALGLVWVVGSMARD